MSSNALFPFDTPARLRGGSLTGALRDRGPGIAHPGPQGPCSRPVEDRRPLLSAPRSPAEGCGRPCSVWPWLPVSTSSHEQDQHGTHNSNTS